MILERVHPKVRLAAGLDLIGPEEAQALAYVLAYILVIVVCTALMTR